MSDKKTEYDAPMVVNGVWAAESMPTVYIVERADGTLAKFFVTPMKKIEESDLTVYKGYHPRKLHAVPMGEYLYRFYGLKKNQETASEVIRVRYRPSDLKILKEAAQNAGVSLSDYIRGKSLADD